MQQESRNSEGLHTSSANIDMGSPTSTAPRYSGVGRTNSKAETVPKRIYPQEPKSIQDRFDIERRAWDYYGKAWDRILEQITHEKYQRKHELRVIERRKQKLVEWKLQLDSREARILEAEPFLDVAKQLQSLDVIPWVEMIREKVEAEKIDYKAAVAQIKQDLQYYQQLGGIERQIQKANQELGLINMTAIRKQQALRVVEGLLNRGISVTNNQFLVAGSTAKQ